MIKKGDVIVVADDDDEDDINNTASGNRVTATLCTEESFLRTMFIYSFFLKSASWKCVGGEWMVYMTLRAVPAGFSPPS
jgi:hypothetical protein